MAASVKDCDACAVNAGIHKGKSGVVQHCKTSKSGHFTINVRQANGECFRTLAQNAATPA